MPNWCMNEITFDSSKIEEVRALVRSDEALFDFNKIIPMPQEEEDNWYEWCWNNWGTKWNASDPWELHWGGYSFDTAWAPSIPVTKVLSSLVPDTEFTHIYYESGVGFAGEVVCLNGEIISDVEYEVGSDDYYEFIFEMGLEDKELYYKGKYGWQYIGDSETIDGVIIPYDTQNSLKNGDYEELEFVDEETKEVLAVEEVNEGAIVLENGVTISLGGVYEKRA